jgi:REP element-mobilizing transposase RayT
MSGSYTQILLHIVFATKHREPMINDDIRDRLYAYLGGIVRAEQGTLYSIGGIEDHVHLLIRWRADAAISDLMRPLKSRSTKWVKNELGNEAFAWQEGYAAFSVSKSQEDVVRAYIAKQAEHHRAVGFREELIKMLDAHGVEYDARWIDE